MTSSRSHSRHRRPLPHKRMFQVAVWDDCDPHAGTRTLIALADDAADLCNLQVFDDTEIVTVVTLPGLVATNGPSRVIGATRNVWSAPRSR